MRRVCYVGRAPERSWEKNQIILYGAGSRGVRVYHNLISKGFKKQQLLFCDSNSNLWNTMLCGIKVISLDELKSLPSDTCFIISSSVRYEIIPKLLPFSCQYPSFFFVFCLYL